MHCIKSMHLPDEESFPYRNEDMISWKLDEDNNLELFSVDKLPTRWIDFTLEINLDQYEKVHDGNGERCILRSKTEQNVYMKVILPVTAAAQLE